MDVKNIKTKAHKLAETYKNHINEDKFFQESLKLRRWQ